MPLKSASLNSNGGKLKTFLSKLSSDSSIRALKPDSRRQVCSRVRRQYTDCGFIHVSERRNRVEWRSCAALDGQRCGRQQKLPTLTRSGGFAQRFKIAII